MIKLYNFGLRYNAYLIKMGEHTKLFPLSCRMQRIYFSILKGSDDGVLYLIKPHFWTLSIITGYKTTFRELALLPSSGKRGDPTQLGPLKRASHSHWTLCFYNL
jgi:hypothetical protein